MTATELTTAVAASRSTCRVAVREVREYTWRALVAAGWSNGEAAAAARAVAFAEVHLGAGVAAAATAAHRPRVGRVGIDREVVRDFGAEVLRDPAGRGLLHLVPLALGLLTSSPVPRPVHLPGLVWDPVLAGLLASTPSPARPALVAVAVDRYGAVGPGLEVSSCGDVSILGGDDLEELRAHNPRLLTAAGLGAGVLLATDHAGVVMPQLSPTVSAQQCRVRWATAHASGVLVDAAAWGALAAAAERFLVPER